MENNGNYQDELRSFREQWRQSLQQQAQGRLVSEDAPSSAENSKSNDQSNSPSSASPTTKPTENEDIENKAKILYLTGVSLEQKRRVREAVGYYRQAIQLVPDIESRISDFKELTASNPESVENIFEEDFEENYDDDDYDDDCDNRETCSSNISQDLLEVVKQFDTMSMKGICQPEFPTTGTHISALPAEVIMYIFKWVVSTALDLRSLEQLAMVCHGFYALARDQEMWRLVCVRIWGSINLGSPLTWSGCWRQMFLKRAHLQYNGVYISRISYLRACQSCYEHSWSPYQVVVYYRYLRFFTDGSVLFDTTAEEPQSSVHRLLKKNNDTPSKVSTGHFKLVGNKVIIIVRKPDTVGHTVIRRGRRHAATIRENFLQLELQLQHTKKKRNNRLTWLKFSSKTLQSSTGQTTVSEFDITERFSPFYFSRVRSYERPASAPLGLGRP